MPGMWWKALLIWLIFMLGAIANGAVRIKAILPFTGEAIGHIISTAMLCTIILVITWCTVGWLAPGNTQHAISLGAAWLLMTLSFELGVGYFISHRSWPEMLADYNVLKGRVWVAVPVITFIAPWWMAKLRGILP